MFDPQEGLFFRDFPDPVKRFFSPSSPLASRVFLLDSCRSIRTVHGLGILAPSYVNRVGILMDARYGKQLAHTVPKS
jgi:hypothetical protein